MYKTGNPVPSTALEDMADNAQTFDALVTKTEGTTTDRKGVNRRVFQQIIMDMGFQPLAGSFQTGATITARNQTLYDEVSHAFYAWGGTIPVGGYVITAGSTPTTSGGVGAGAWVDRTDVTLRRDINIVQKRFACVADAVADTSLTIGKIIETIGYHNGWVGTSDEPKGGNRYEVVAGGTGTEDGGSYINLNNGLQIKTYFSGDIDVYKYGFIDGEDLSTIVSNIVSVHPNANIVLPRSRNATINTKSEAVYSSSGLADEGTDPIPAIGNPQYNSALRYDTIVKDGSDRVFNIASQIFSGDSLPSSGSSNPFNDNVAGYFGAYRGANSANAPMAINGLVQAVARTQIVCNVSGTSVTLVSGEYFRDAWVGSRIVIEGTYHVTAKIASVESDTSMTLSTDLGTKTGVTLLIGNSVTCCELDVNCYEDIDVNSPISYNGLNVASGGANSPLTGINVSGTSSSNGFKHGLLMSGCVNYGIRIINPGASCIGFSIKQTAQSVLDGGSGLLLKNTQLAIQHVPLTDSDTSASIYGTNAASTVAKWIIYQNGDTTLRAHPFVYNSDGSLFANRPFFIRGTATIGAGGTVDVYMTTKNFTSASSYFVSISNMTGARAVSYSISQLNKFTITGTAGDVVSWLAYGY